METRESDIENEQIDANEVISELLRLNSALTLENAKLGVLLKKRDATIEGLRGLLRDQAAAHSEVSNA